MNYLGRPLWQKLLITYPRVTNPVFLPSRALHLFRNWAYRSNHCLEQCTVGMWFVKNQHNQKTVPIKQLNKTRRLDDIVF